MKGFGSNKGVSKESKYKVLVNNKLLEEAFELHSKGKINEAATSNCLSSRDISVKFTRASKFSDSSSRTSRNNLNASFRRPAARWAWASVMSLSLLIADL